MNHIVLGSSSAIRAQLLRSAGVTFETMAARIDETKLLRRWRAEGAGAAARALAQAKALAVSRAAPEALVIGADQILEFEGELLEKAADMAEARTRLLRMRGADHVLVNGCALVRDGAELWSEVSTTRITLRRFSESFLNDWLDRAGAGVLASVCCYEIEGSGAQLLERIDGDYFSALGLPLLPLLGALRQFGGLPE